MTRIRTTLERTTTLGRRLRISLFAIALAAAGLAAVPPASAASATGPAVVPRPASMQAGKGMLTLTPAARIVAPRGAASAVAADLAGYLRPATGYPLPIVSDRARPGDIRLALGPSAQLASAQAEEGYVLDVTRSGASLAAETPHGLYDGVQTIRQLLPAAIERRTRTHATWTMPAVHVVDSPRYAYRGLMVDIARHFQSPDTVKRLIDQAAAYKINTLHLHVSDDQGFRIVIDGFPRLTGIGSQGSVGTDGRTMDPGGYWTQQEYKDVVAYAAAHFIQVVPEVDSPGHNNAIINSEYDDTANPLLDGHPQDINCSRNDPPRWNYTGSVGYSAMCPESANTQAIYRAIITQLAAMSSSRYYDIGGDEVPATTLSQERYAAFVNSEAPLVRAQGRTVMGWAEMAGGGADPGAGSLAEYWNPASGSDAGTASGREAVAKGMKILMAPANHAYLDQKYAPGVPAHTGLTWACGSGGCDVDRFYNWDPATYVDGVTESDITGVEGAIWGETTRNLDEIDYLVFPRLLALAEIGWTPQPDRSYDDFLVRLGAQGPRLTYAGTSFYASPQVPWESAD